jgi:hypothetical protein
MSRAGSLRAMLTGPAPAASTPTNVVPLDRVTAAKGAAAQSGAIPEDFSELLAQLDELVAEQARQPSTETAHSERGSPQALALDVEAHQGGQHDVAPATAATSTAPGQLEAAMPRNVVLGPAEAINLVNRTHFTAPAPVETSIWREGFDHETNLRTVTPVSTNSFRLEFAPFTVNVATPNGLKGMQLADLWMRSKHRREYRGGVILQPEGATPAECFNLWQGFGVAPLPGDASPMVDHVHMLCGGVSDLAEYVLNWFALCVQHPGSRPEVALVLRGGRGTGKGTVFRIMLMIFGRHGLHITQPKHLVGNFNSHLRTALFLFADECHWPGDKASEGVLKGLITEPTIAIEMKGRDVFTAPNRIKLAMASNNDWVVPAGADERRYCVIDVSKDRAQDHAYFAQLNAWIDGNGAAIFLAHLLARDLSAFNVRAVPKTAALDRQKIEGMSALDRWILEALDTGTGVCGVEWTDHPYRAVCDTAVANFDLYCRRASVRGTRADTRTIGRRFNEVFGCGPATVQRNDTQGRGRAWTLPGLQEAQARAAAAFGLAQYEWGAA